MSAAPDGIRAHLLSGHVIPAHPLALTKERKLDERRQRALTRYYVDSGAGGLAVGVHTTQFAIREPRYGLYAPVLELAAETVRERTTRRSAHVALIAGLCGRTEQACKEAETARGFGYDAGLLSLGAMRDADDDELVAHCRAVAETIPLFGFYLQPAVGGRPLGISFWRRFVEIPGVVAIKIAPFNRYQTLDVVRAIAESGREDIALYTGNDDSIVVDLLTDFRLSRPDGGEESVRIVGGLLGHWAVWTRAAADLLERCRVARLDGKVPGELLTTAAGVTEMNAAVFDAANGFAGCIAGIHEVLRAQGLLEGVWCLDPAERLSPGQAEEIDRVRRAYPELTDDPFVAANAHRWLQ